MIVQKPFLPFDGWKRFFVEYLVFQQPHRPLPNLFLHELESLGRQIIPHMPLKPKSQQLSELFSIFVGHKAFGSSEKVVVYARNERVDVLLKRFRAFVILRSGLIEQGISVVKERGRRGNGVGFVVDHKAEVAVVPVCIADDRIKTPAYRGKPFGTVRPDFHTASK